MDPLQERLAAAEREAEQLRQQLTALQTERDQFRTLYLEELARNAPEIAQADLDRAIPTGPWFEDFLRRLEIGELNALESWPTR